MHSQNIIKVVLTISDILHRWSVDGQVVEFVTDDLDTLVYLLTFSRAVTCTDLNNVLHLVRCAIPNTLNNVH